MILNKLVFPIKIGATFVEGAIPTGKLTANNINKDMFYVISPVVGATAITATFQNSLQSERPEYMNMEPSSLKVSDLVRESESYYDLIKDWNVWQGFMPSKALEYVAYNRAGEIGISFNFRQVIVPHMVGQTYRGDISSEDFIPTENGYYIVKTPLFIYDDIEFTFNDVLIKLDDEILIKKAIFTAENTSTLNYSVDPSVYDSDFEGFDISITESIVHQINENTTDIKILFSNQNGIYYDIVELEKRVKQNEDDIALIQQKDIDQDSEIERLNDEKTDKTYVDAQDQILDDRIDTIIAGTVEGVSGAEIVDARGGYPVLGDRLDVLSNIMPHFERYVIESRNKAHFSGFPYTSFGGGCTFNGMELYAQRSGKFHNSMNNPADWGVIVMYNRLEDGSFSPTIVDLPYSTLDGEARDVNLSVSPDGKYLYMKFFTNAGVYGVYSGYLVVYDRTMTQVGMIKIVDNADWVVWGNTLRTPNGYLLTASYATSPSKVGIYRSSSPVYDDYSSVTFEKVAEITQNDITESTLGYWGDKLVMVSRREHYSGNSLYYETSNLEGDSGWGSLENIGHIVYAPAIKPYNEEPVLLVSGTLRINSDLRQPMLLARKWQGGWTNPSVIDKEMEDYGGYTSLVPNRYGYGIMYYDDTTPRTTVYFKDVNVDTYLPEYKKWLMDSENYISQEIVINKVDISKQVPKTPDMIGRVGVDNDGSLWYAPYRDDIIKVREMNSLDSMVSYEGTLQPNLTHVDNSGIRVYSNTLDHVFPFNEMKESVDLFNNKFIDVPVIYWKFYHDALGNLTGYDISNKKIDDTFDTFPIHAKGKLSIGKYQAYSQGGKLYSISAVDPSMSKNIASFRQEAKAVGDDYFSNDWQSWNMLQLLLTAYFGTKNTDLYFPDVNGTKSNTGTMDGYKTAVNLATGKNVFFGIENIVKNGRHFIDGVINNNEEVWFANDHTKYSNVITEDYVLKGTKPTQNGYIRNYGGGLGLFPTENTGASSTTYYCDFLYFNPDLKVLFSGSNWDALANRGVWLWSADYVFSDTLPSTGSRLIKTS